MRTVSPIRFGFLFTSTLLMTGMAPCLGQKARIHTAEQPLAPEEAVATMGVPEGFRVTLFAGEPDVMQPIGFCIDDRGRLWVAEAYNYPNHGARPGDRIVILEDSDGDGHHDKRTVFYDGLNYVSGIEVGFGGAWVMSPPSMYFIPDRDGDDVPDGDPKILLDGFGDHANAHNMANGFAWGPDGWLYATHGRTNWSMIGKPEEDESQRRRFDGGVWRYHPVRHVWEPFADGTTNPWGIDWNDYGDAFICNCVNPHLFQVIQGAHYEPWRGRKSSEFAYQRIDTIADHLHFVGLGNVRNGLGSQAEDSAGGGHAHCGTMIYLGNQFPPKYRNQLFTNNIHGRRINNDLLRQSGSGYVASHGPDLMRSRDPWFMGVTLGYGPGGEVYVSDWSDTGECHSTRDTRRHTGRIYRLTYLETEMERADVASHSNAELVDLQLHDNDWHVRHARRILHERASAGQDMSDVRVSLRKMLQTQPHVAKRLRALWALKVTGGVGDDLLVELLSDENPNLRAWAVQLVCEDRDPPPTALARMLSLAKSGDSPRVRLAIASALQRLQPDQVWPIAEALASRSEDADDANLPLMTWYAVEPLIHHDLDRYARLAVGSSVPRVSENIARRMFASSAHAAEGSEMLLARIADGRNPASSNTILRGVLLGLEGKRRVTMPDSWPAAYQQLRRHDDSQTRQIAIQLAMVFNDQEAAAELQRLALDANAATQDRVHAIRALVSAGDLRLAESLPNLLDDSDVRGEALRALARFDVPRTASSILTRYGKLTADEKQTALQTLATRRSWALPLLAAMAAGEVPPSDVTAFTARQLRSLGDEFIDERVAQLWGEVRELPRKRARQIEALRKSLQANVLREADLGRGELLFQKHCGTCHRFFGKGGNVGPDITGAQRTNIQYLLENIIDPSASVAKEYRMQLVRTVDGRVISGLVESESDASLTMVTATDRIVIPIDEIEGRRQSETSVMPNGLLDTLSEREIRDLFGYLQR